MGVVSTVAIFSFICLVLVDKTDGDSMTLSSSFATVGQQVTLQCVYIGNYTPVTLNFYFETDTLGLQIDVSLCSFSAWTGYDRTLYDKNCGVKAVNLTIKSVTTADIDKTWHCDASFFTGPLVAKASTTITKKPSSSTSLVSSTAPQPSIPPSNSTSIGNTHCTGVDCLTTAEKIGIGVGCGGGLIISGSIVVLIIYLKRNEHSKNCDDPYAMEPPLT